MSAKGYTLNFLYFTALAVILSYIVNSAFPIKNEIKKSLGYPKESMFNFTELAAENGYITEEHSVVTDDGYVLKIFRVVKAKKCKGKVKKPPVILMHGLLQSSDVWLDAGPNAGLAYLLSDSCYDLWIPNQRGNYYSRNHKILNPDKDAKFWNFSVDEIGYYDIPPIIDYVLKYTYSVKVNYIGYSQGCGTFYIMCSERPGYCDKVNIKISLAPAARQTNTKSVAYRAMTQTVDKLKNILTASGISEAFSKGALSQEFLGFFCQIPLMSRSICSAVEAIIDSDHPGSISRETSRIIFSHFSAGTSVQNLARYGQAMKTPYFQKFDYGKNKNIEIYNTTIPPQYNLKAVTVPVVIIYGKNDYLVDPKDIKWLVNKLPNVLEVIEVTDPLWNHFDVPYSQYTGELIFPKMIEYLKKYST